MAKKRGAKRAVRGVVGKRQVGRAGNVPASKRARGRVAAKRSAATRPGVKRPKAKRPSAVRTRPPERSRLFAPIAGSDRRVVGGVQLDIVSAGAARVKRLVYPVGFHWKQDMKPVTGSELCMHAHVGFLAHGEIHIEYADGCIVELKAPQVVVIEPGHDGWVVGNDPAVLIEIDFERQTIERLGVPSMHSH